MRVTRGARLVAAICGVALMGACSAAERAPRAFEDDKCTPDVAWPAADQGLADEVLRLTNEHRATRGAPTLTFLPVLQDAANWKARHMAAGSYLDHDDQAPPVARTYSQRVKDCGFSGSTTAENIAMGYSTPREVFEGWLGSPGHRRNIENPNYNVAGMAAAVDSEGDPYWVQVFAFSEGAGASSPGTDPGVDEVASPPPDETPDAVVNQPPIARPDRLRVKAGVRIRTSVIINDNDPDGDEIRILSVGPAMFGTAKIHPETGSIIYRSRSSAAGDTERLTYTITDELGATAESVLVIPIR